MEAYSTKFVNDQNNKHEQSSGVFQFVDGLDEEGSYMPSPFGGDVQDGTLVEDNLVDGIGGLSPNVNNLGQIAIPTPPPERSRNSPDSTHSSHGSNTSAQLSASATSDSYIKGSSLEESPVSSPNSSCAGEEKSEKEMGIIRRESCIRSSSSSSSVVNDRKYTPDKEPSAAECVSQEQKVPKNIKLPQRKGGMQLWQFLYALLNDPDKKYHKLIEWTANSLSREFRLLEPEAIAIWWGEHKNKKNMSYDKLSRSLRYYYDKGIIRKISGERYVYQFCIDPELMYKHIGNSESRPKLKPMPQSAYRATSEYQSQHGFTNSMMSKDSCFVTPGPMSLGIMHSHLPPSRPPFPPPSYPSPFLTHAGYSDISADFHYTQPLGTYSATSFFPPGYDSMNTLSHMPPPLGYPPIEPPQLPLKTSLPPLKKSVYELPSLTPVSNLKYESSFGQSPLLHSDNSSQNVILSSHTLSPPPLTHNRAASPITPSLASPPTKPYSNHSSPHSYIEDPLNLDELISADEYSSGSLSYVPYSREGNNTQSQVTNSIAVAWEDL